MQDNDQWLEYTNDQTVEKVIRCLFAVHFSFFFSSLAQVNWWNFLAIRDRMTHKDRYKVVFGDLSYEI